MSCKGITQFLEQENGRFMPGAMFRDMFPTSIWIALFSAIRGEFPNDLSEIITNWTFGRSAPDVAEPEWQALTSEDGDEGGSCLPPVSPITFSSKPRTFRLFRQALEGPDFCAEKFRSTVDLKMQLDNLTDAMTERVRIEWELHDRAEYSRMTDSKVVVNDCANPARITDASGVATYPAVEATQVPGLGFWAKEGYRLTRDGSSPMLMQNGSPVFNLITPPEYSDNLLIQNENLRQDIRWADSGKSNGARLLAPFGVNYTLRNWMFTNDILPRKFNWNGSAHVQVPTYIKYLDYRGWNYKINPAWESAGEVEITVYDETVMKQLVPVPIVNPATNFRFDPVSYVGSIQVKNIEDRKCNPDKNILFHRMILAASSMPVKPRRGVSYLIKSCGTACDNVTACPTNT